MTGATGIPDSLAAPVLTVAGSGTVLPVAEAWRDLLPTNYSYTVGPGGSSTGAKRVCLPYDDPEHVMIGMMSRDWKTKEAERMDDGYTLECLDRETRERTGRRVTQLMVGIDGLAMAVKTNGFAYDCVMHPDVGGLTSAQLRWIFSDWTMEQLVAGPYGNVIKESIIPNDNDNGIKEWSDISSVCAQVPINPYGTGSQSGTTDLVTGALFNGEEAEEYPWCNMSQVAYLETLPPDEMANYIQNHRDLVGPPNCYIPSEVDDYDIIKDWLLADTGGIAYVAYAYYTKYSDVMRAMAIASDPEYGIQDTQAAVITPTESSIIDGSYNLFTRNLYMNVDNTAWEVARAYLLNGFSPHGQAAVEGVGYVTVNEAIRARMVVICKQGSNPLADYILVPPEYCWNGTELVSFPYINFAGNPKENFTCQACALGDFKRSNAADDCDHCEPGTMSATTGASACEFCPIGRFANESSSTSCTSCPTGFVNAIPGSTSCESCTAGHFQAQAGKSTCQACPPGEFQPDAGMSSCQRCGVGTFAALEGSVQCVPCDPGFYQEAAAANASCSRCPKGTYSTSVAASACMSCLEGLTTQYVGAYDISHCVCTTGSYMPPGSDSTAPFPCKPCPAGMECPEGSSYGYLPGIVSSSFQCPEDEIVCNYPLVKPGHMTIASEPLKVYKCLHEEFCPGWDPGQCAYLRDPEEVACGNCVSSAYKRGDECRPCGNGSNILFIVFAIVGLVVVLGAAAFAVNKDVTRQSNSTLAVAIVAGLTFGGLQTLGVLNTMNLAWFEPMKSIMEFASVLGLDLSMLRVSCQVGTGPFVNYLCRQCLAPGLVPLVLVLLVMKKKLFQKDIVIWVELTNTVGAVYSILFISVVISALTPVVCYDHPGGNGSSVVGMSAVLCFEDADWWGLLTIGSTSMTVVTLPFLALCFYAIWSYQHFLASGNLSMVKAFQFLFIRFRAETYYYGGLLLLRNFLIPCIPAMIRSDVIFQLMLMTVTVLGFSYLQVFLQPWRTVSVNLFDMCLALFIILILACGTASSNLSASKESLMVLGTAIFVSACLTVFGFFAWLCINRLWRRKMFDAFICHHKHDAAAQSRFLKMCLTQTGKLKVFIDSDDLLHLDGLFEIVKTQISRLVVYLTRDTLSRPWCCGEVVTAHTNRVSTSLVRTQSFIMPGSPYTLQQCEELLSESDDSCLMNFGITLDHVQAAYYWLLFYEKNILHELSANVGRKRIGNLAADLLGERRRTQSSSSSTLASKASLQIARGSLVVSSDPGDDEANASAGILANLVQEKIAEMGHGNVLCLCDFDQEQLDAKVDRVRIIVKEAMANVFILTPGSLQSIAQLKVMLLAEQSGSFSKNTIPVTTPYFTFPTEAFYATGLPKLAEEVSEEATGDALVLTVRALFKIIAITLATSSSSTVLHAQAMEVIRRIPPFNPAEGKAGGGGQVSDEIVAQRSSGRAVITSTESSSRYLLVDSPQFKSEGRDRVSSGWTETTRPSSSGWTEPTMHSQWTKEDSPGQSKEDEPARLLPDVFNDLGKTFRISTL